MPLYEYQCSDCAREFDVLRPFHRADEMIDCPACGSSHVRRKISVIALRTDDISADPGSACCGGRCGCAPHSGQG
ncbi:MAG: zinc ribbon domain-containing protein [Roseiflexaceae bacterium]|nr:zinc ribbon domain-containing protein [Roseiflexus sp.]MDW8211979.1 zinc ribbon domain-containing protein [Roseiflexaceae bacterium]